MSHSSRHPSNPNLHLYYEPLYKGLPLLTECAPFVEEYLETLHQTMVRANQEYPRLMALRVDLIPEKTSMARLSEQGQRALLARFIESLKAQIAADRLRAGQRSRRAAGCTLRYVWCREFFRSQPSQGYHFHFLFLFNKDAYFTPGRIGQEGDNLVNRISKAWRRALGVGWDPYIPLIHLPRNACYLIKSRGDREGIEKVFKRTSYLCKADTKVYGDHRHAFGASRV